MIMLPRTIATERLELRAVGPEQAEKQAAAVNASREELGTWMPWAQNGQTPDQARENLAQSAEEFGTASFEYSVWLGDEFVGRCGVHAYDARIPKGEIGYWIATAHAHHGLAREATQGLIDAMLATGFRRIEIRCDALNARSAAIPRALGMTQDALFVNDDVSAADPTELRDTLVFSLTR